MFMQWAAIISSNFPRWTGTGGDRCLYFRRSANRFRNSFIFGEMTTWQ